MSRVLLNDTSVLINLLATGHVEEIIRGSSWEFAIAEPVLKEALYLYDPDSSQREPIDLQPLVDAGFLDVWDLEGEGEAEPFVGFAACMDDAEAVCFALAQHRRCAVAIDDRRAIKRALALYPEFEIVSTPDIIHQWKSSCGVTDQTLREALRSIESRARLRPRDDDPLAGWWKSGRR